MSSFPAHFSILDMLGRGDKRKVGDSQDCRQTEPTTEREYKASKEQPPASDAACGAAQKEQRFGSLCPPSPGGRSRGAMAGRARPPPLPNGLSRHGAPAVTSPPPSPAPPKTAREF